MIENQLKQLGFNKNEIKVYLSMFGLGQCKAGQIIEQTGLHRNLVYTSLEELVSKNLVSKVEHNGVAVFSVNDPGSILDIVEAQKRTAEDVVVQLQKKQEETPKDIKVFEGLEGVKRSRERSLSLSKDDTVYILGASAFSSAPELERYWKSYHQRRAKKGINLKILYDKTTSYDILDWRNNLEKTQAKYLPLNIESPTWFEMYGDFLNIGIPGDDPIVFSMRNKEAADSLKKYFEYFWNQETQVLKGVDVLKELWLEGIDCKEIRWIGARGYFVDRYPEIFKEIKAKAERTPGVVWKNIVDPGFKGHALTKLPWTETKYNLGEVRNPTAIWLFGDKVLIVNWAEDVPVIFQSTNKQLVQSYSDYFEEMWMKGE